MKRLTLSLVVFIFFLAGCEQINKQSGSSAFDSAEITWIAKTELAIRPN